MKENKSPTESYKMEIIDFSKIPEPKPPVLKNYEIWIGFVGSWGQGDHDSTAPVKLGEAKATTFKIACCILEHQRSIDNLNERMKQPNAYIEDAWFGHWGYNPKDNSTHHLGKFYETKEEAQKSFKY